MKLISDSEDIKRGGERLFQQQRLSQRRVRRPLGGAALSQAHLSSAQVGIHLSPVLQPILLDKQHFYNYLYY